MLRPKYIGSITFRGFELPANEVEALVGIKASALADQGEILKPGTRALVRSFARWSVDFQDSTRLDDMIPVLISEVGGAVRLAEVKLKVSPEFFELDLALFIKDSEEQEGGFLDQGTIAMVASLGLSLSLGFYSRSVAYPFHRGDVPKATSRPLRRASCQTLGLMDETSVTVRLTAADYAETTPFILESLDRQIAMYWPSKIAELVVGALILLGVSALLFSAPLQTPTQLRGARTSAFLLLGAIALSVVWSMLYKRLAKRLLFKAGSPLLETSLMVFSNEGFSVSSGRESIQLPWTSFIKVDFTERHAYLFTHPGSAIAIPAHAFANQAEFNSFKERVVYFARGNVP